MSIIESYTWSLFTWSDSVINNDISWPIFTWLWSFINVIIDFRPVFVLVAFFGLILSLFYWLFNRKKDKNNKSLENK